MSSYLIGVNFNLQMLYFNTNTHIIMFQASATQNLNALGF